MYEVPVVVAENDAQRLVDPETETLESVKSPVFDRDAIVPPPFPAQTWLGPAPS
jgi:hypothetical protein